MKFIIIGSTKPDAKKTELWLKFLKCSSASMEFSDSHVAYDPESFEFALGFSAMIHEVLSHEPPRNYIRKRGKCWPISSSVFSLNLEEPRVGTSILNAFSRSLEHEQL